MTNYFILVGDEATWKTSFKNNWWGFANKNKGMWASTEINDMCLLYVTSPIKKCIGMAIVTDKFKDETLFWPDELFFERSMWPLKLKFRILYDVKNWDDGIKLPATLILNQGRKKISYEMYSNIIQKAWPIEISGISEKIKK